MLTTPTTALFPINYPIFTVARLKAIPLYQLAYELAKARLELSLGHAVQVYGLLEELTKPSRHFRAVMPYDTRADGTKVVSKMSIVRIVDINWTGLGGKPIVCRYKTILSESSLLISNILTRLGDGNMVLNVVLHRKRRQLLGMEVKRLVVDAQSEAKA
jgi:hypothetical protein